MLACVGSVIWMIAFCSPALPQDRPQKKRIAVLNFEDDTGGGLSPAGAIGAATQDVGKGISAKLIEKLNAGGKYTIVDRSGIQQLLDEQNSTPEADHLDAYALAAKIGQMLGLDAMIIGTITRFGPEAAPTGGGGGRPGINTRKSKAFVEINTRVLNMTTGEVIAGFTATGESAATGTVMHIIPRGQPQVTPEIMGPEFVDSLLADATRNAIDKLAEQLNVFAEKIPFLKMEIDGLVAEIGENSITLNIGSKSGLKLGDKLVVIREIASPSEPSSTVAQSQVVEKVAEATVTEVSNVYSTAICSQSAQVHVGDRVRSAAKLQPASQ
jgi:curli biogenesis system outer membrane secretion channel CsgG